MGTQHRFIFVSILFLCAAHTALAQLTVHTTAYGSKPGYIDNATLVVEPHGAYVEQSLYLYYGDHGQYPGSKLVEIIHYFRLPANAVVNDMWLWMGNDVMQAIMLDTWKARSIYDSITSSLHDPAFLAKRGEVYELHVFPLVSGSLRKVKINYIVPTRWLGNRATAELPLGLLQGSNATIKPLEILFRETEPVWGKPMLTELPTLDFLPLKDTNGYHFRFARIDDVTKLSEVSLGFGSNFTDGTFFASSRRQNDADYFQFGFDPASLFPVPKDTASRRLLFAIDLSGERQKNFALLIPKLKQALRSAAKPTDSIRIVVAGSERINELKQDWTVGSPDSIEAIINRFSTSPWGKEIAASRFPFIQYTDQDASTCWKFPDIEQFANVKQYSSPLQALRDSSKGDVLATYNYGSSDRLNHPVELINQCDTAFQRGMRILTYYDYNRTYKNEVIASHYITGLGWAPIPEYTALLNGNPSGNFGKEFEANINHVVFNYLSFDIDPAVKVELTDSFGHPYVISKKVQNGLLVVSSIWGFRADGALKKMINVPLLGLSAPGRNQLLLDLLKKVRTLHDADPCDRVYVISNSDTLLEAPEATSWRDIYLAGFFATPPQFTTVNLLDGTSFMPRMVTEQLVDYYASGCLLKSVADATHGRHFETHSYSWNTICALLDPLGMPLADSMSVTVVADGGAGQLKEMHEVDPVPQDPNKARFFIGAVSKSDSLSITIRADFGGTVGTKTWTGVRYINPDSTRMDNIIPPMLGNEHLRDLFRQTPRDTALIVKTAMRYRLLCDFTALLALEPNDTLHFMKDPFDETKLLDVPETAGPVDPDSISIAVAPNPFRGETSIALRVAHPSFVTVAVYDRLGRLLRTLASSDAQSGSRLYRWDGLDAQHHPAPAGLYFLRVLAKEQATGLTRTAHRNLVLME